MKIIKNGQYDYTKSEDKELTVESLLSELEHVVRQEVTVNNTWQLLYNILRRENRI